jgi:hypothetical protein
MTQFVLVVKLTSVRSPLIGQKQKLGKRPEKQKLGKQKAQTQKLKGAGLQDYGTTSKAESRKQPRSDSPVLGEFAEHLAVGCAAQHSVAEVFDNLRLAVVDRPSPSNPSQPFIAGRIHDEELAELRNCATDLPVVVGFAPIGKAFP